VWNVVHTNPNQEAPVARFFQLQGIEVYAPQFAAPARTRPRSVRGRRHRWIFPGYLFIKAPADFSRWDLVQRGPGVRRLLTQGGSPSVVDEAVIDRLRSRSSAAPQARPAFHTGQRLVIERGPLAMVDAIFDRELNSSERVQVLVHLLGRPMAVAVDAAILRPAS
jgi:transcription antitermination factor NusG